MAMDFATDGIRVNSVSPGWTWSRVIAEVSGNNREKADSVAADYHLLGRLGHPEEVANVVLFFIVTCCELCHRSRLCGRWRIFSDGP